MYKDVPSAQAFARVLKGFFYATLLPFAKRLFLLLKLVTIQSQKNNLIVATKTCYLIAFKYRNKEKLYQKKRGGLLSAQLIVYRDTTILIEINPKPYNIYLKISLSCSVKP